MWFHSKGRILLHVYHCVFFLTVVQILVGRLHPCFLTHTKKYMTPIHALIFQKHVKMCVYSRYQKVGVTFLHFGGVHAAKKGWLGGHFCRTRVRRVRVRKPRREFEGSALEPFFMFF